MDAVKAIKARVKFYTGQWEQAQAVVGALEELLKAIQEPDPEPKTVEAVEDAGESETDGDN